MKKVTLGLVIAFVMFMGFSVVNVQAATEKGAAATDMAPAPAADAKPAATEAVVVRGEPQTSNYVSTSPKVSFMSRVRSFFENIVKFFSTLGGGSAATSDQTLSR